MALIRVRNLLQKFSGSESFRLARIDDFSRDGECRLVYELILTIHDLEDHQRPLENQVKELRMSRKCFLSAKRCTRQQTLTIEMRPQDLVLPRQGKCYIARKIRNDQERRTRVYTELEVCEPVIDGEDEDDSESDIFAVLFLVKENRIHTGNTELAISRRHQD
ncbi:MAG: hypothetical protein RLZZ347_119 [Candidatus Parcubacteria bacterium]